MVCTRACASNAKPKMGANSELNDSAIQTEPTLLLAYRCAGKCLNQLLRLFRTDPGLQHLMRAIDNVIFNALLIEAALAECETGESNEEFLFAARHHGESSLHIDEMSVIGCKIIKESGGGIDKSDSLLIPVVVVVDSVELIVHDAYQMANDKPMFRKRLTAVNGVTHRFNQAKDMETDSA